MTEEPMLEFEDGATVPLSDYLQTQWFGVAQQQLRVLREQGADAEAAISATAHYYVMWALRHPEQARWWMEQLRARVLKRGGISEEEYDAGTEEQNFLLNACLSTDLIQSLATGEVSDADTLLAKARGEQ